MFQIRFVLSENEKHNKLWITVMDYYVFIITIYGFWRSTEPIGS